MDHLGGLLLLLALLTWHRRIWGAAGHVVPRCQQVEFRCSDGSCIPRLRVCNGHKDCEDGSDERQCSGHGVDGPVRCGAGEFPCSSSSRRCVPLQVLCDGMDDCGDGWDASRWPCASRPPRPPCAASEFQCGDGQCVRQAWRCDGAWDCPDGSDEDRCDQDECQINNGGCSHHCVKQPVGFICQCPDDMRLVGDSHCEEVDMCLEVDVCDQVCVHTNTSLTCACNQGFRLNAASGECRAEGDEAQLAFSSSTGLHWIRVSDTELRELGPRGSGPGPVAVLASNRTLYWAKQGLGSIYSVSLEAPPRKAAVVLKVQGSVSGLAVDWVHQLLYWTSVESGSVSIGLLDGSAHRRLITGLDRPSGLAVDPLQGLLFWTQCGSAPKIERSSLDGQDRTALVTSFIRRPVVLALDVPRQLLYWADQQMRTISRVTFDGRHRKTVVESNGYLDRPFGLSVFEGFVYWSDEVTRSICRANKHNGSQLQVLLRNITSPGDVVVFHPALQPNGPSVCGRSGAVCQHQCVVSLLSQTPEFRCISALMEPNRTQSPAVSRLAPASSPSDPLFAEVLFLITFLSVLLVGTTLCWWREEFRLPGSLTVQSLSLTESQDPLITQQPLETPKPDLGE
ncbi:low-density lipoprotein receptor-like isoform X2 [Betta splendens]|uniref:Low-density lipoprotein receptor-like isoform X2 n=1 Tax=Betta splendens TaxID=158456 RepID=A0A6P7MET6_BETSP|nr:low-density lipoprotein receptor-like isoform X2 [Betta splendens]XP_029004455.1 low-density lipoprotein receptor-like isoform X2 [Betta splendens]